MSFRGPRADGGAANRAAATSQVRVGTPISFRKIRNASPPPGIIRPVVVTSRSVKDLIAEREKSCSESGKPVVILPKKPAVVLNNVAPIEKPAVVLNKMAPIEKPAVVLDIVTANPPATTGSATPQQGAVAPLLAPVPVRLHPSPRITFRNYVPTKPVAPNLITRKRADLLGETYSRIELVRSYGNLQSYWTTTKLWKLTVVLNLTT